MTVPCAAFVFRPCNSRFAARKRFLLPNHLIPILAPDQPSGACFLVIPFVVAYTVRCDHPLLVAYQQARCNPWPMIVDVVSDMPGNQWSLRLRRDTCRVTTPRSEERRVGKEGVSTCRSRWSPYH